MTGNTQKILIIDDDKYARKGMGHWLCARGYEVAEAEDGFTGLSQAALFAPNLILLDLRMPGMDGLKFLEKFQSERENCPIIVVSGAGDQADTVSAFRLGAWDYISKPIDNMDILDHCIKSVLERKALRDSVREAMQSYHHLVNNLPLVLFVLRRDLSLEFINDFCLPMLGVAPEEALGSPGWLLERVHEPDRARFLAHIEACFSSCLPERALECRIEHANGSILHVLFKSLPVRDCEPGQPILSIEGLFMDITDRVMLEKFLVQKEKINTLGAITAEVAHEIRNPLMSIAGFARLLEKKYPGEAGATIILSESERLERIMDRIRDYLHPVKMSPEPCDMRRVLDTSLELLGPEIREKGVSARLESVGELPLVFEDLDVLTQVALNLLRNAMHGLNSGEEFGVRLFESGAHVMLEVRSAAPLGVSDPELLFLPFDEGGQSVGLPFCYRMLKIMGGSLSFEKLGREMIFTASLPLKNWQGGRLCR